MSKQIETLSPIDGSVYVTRQLANDSDVAQAVASAAQAQALWKQTTLADRQDICRRFVEIFIAEKDAIAEEILLANGTPHSLCGR